MAPRFTHASQLNFKDAEALAQNSPSMEALRGTPYFELAKKGPGVGVQILKDYIRSALDMKRKGNSLKYDHIVQQLYATGNSVALRRWFQALTHCVSALSDDFDALLTSILRFNLWSADDTVIDAFMKFNINLVSANGSYIEPSFHMLVQQLAYDPEEANEDDDDDRTGTSVGGSMAMSVGGASATRESMLTASIANARANAAAERVFSRVHQQISAILQMFPTSASCLIPILQEHFPHKRRSLTLQRIYLQNVLRVAEYAPVLREPILALVIDKIIQIDVEIKLEEIPDDYNDSDDDDDDDGDGDVDDSADSADENGVFDMDMDGENRGGGDDDEAKSQRGVLVDEMAEKLDMMLGVIYRFIQIQSEKSPSVRDELFVALMLIFERSVLNTFKSKYTQYIIFYSMSLHPPYVDYFLKRLLEKLFDPKEDTVSRRSSAAYIGSFLARAKYVSPTVLRAVLDVLFPWINAYMDLYEPSVSFPDAELHCVFYGVTQALLYMFCYRHAELLADEPSVTYMKRVGYARLLFSKFNPLKVCEAGVVREFVEIAAVQHIVDCRDVLRKNEQLILPTRSAWGGANQLEQFFPFDPYLLRGSAHFITPMYISWEERGEKAYDLGMGAAARGLNKHRSNPQAITRTFDDE